MTREAAVQGELLSSKDLFDARIIRSTLLCWLDTSVKSAHD